MIFDGHGMMDGGTLKSSQRLFNTRVKDCVNHYSSIPKPSNFFKSY